MAQGFSPVEGAANAATRSHVEMRAYAKLYPSIKISNAREPIDRRFAEMHARFAEIHARFTAQDKRFEAMDERLNRVDHELGMIRRDVGTILAKLTDIGIRLPAS